MPPHTTITLTVRDGIANLDKIIPILPLLSMARVRTTWIPHVSTFFQNNILRWSIMPWVVYGNKTEDMQHFHASSSQIFSEKNYSVQCMQSWRRCAETAVQVGVGDVTRTARYSRHGGASATSASCRRPARRRYRVQEGRATRAA